jgi:twitching motility protein PilI
MNAPAGMPFDTPLADAGVLGSASRNEDDEIHPRRRYGVVIGGQRLLLDGSGAVRVLEPGPLSRLPNTHDWFLGLANVRGNLVPVYDLARWQALPAANPGRMLLVVGTDDLAAATLIDDSPRSLSVPATACALPALSAGFAAHAEEAFTLDDGIWTELDWDALFAQTKAVAVLPDKGV